MRKQKIKFYFSVEGDTEKWYLDWLCKTINSCPYTVCYVEFDCKAKVSPCARIRGLKILEKTTIAHFLDKESEEDIHTTNFISVLSNMKRAENLGKNVKYVLGYSNFTFELWMILHKADCMTHLSSRRQYLSLINNVFNQSFQSLDKYKKKENFDKILQQLSLEDVWSAIKRSHDIMEANRKNGCMEKTTHKFKYFCENPSLSVGEIISEIFKQCGVPKM